MQVRTPQALRGARRGVTLIEACTVLAVIAVLAGTALPSMEGATNKRMFEGAVAEVVTEVNFARGAAVAHNRGAWLTYTRVADGTCAMVHVGMKADCQCGDGGNAACVNNGQALKSSLHRVPVSLAAPIHFDPVNGSVTPTATIRVEMGTGKEVHHKVNILGRVRSCSPQGLVKGYAIC